MSNPTKSKVPAMVSGAGMAADVWTNLDREVKQQGGTGEELHLLVRKEGQPILKTLASLLIRLAALLQNIFRVAIKPFDTLKTDGKYGYVNEYITPKNFPFTAQEDDTAQLVLVHFDRDISSEDAVKEMERMGIEPAKIEHLMAYGAQHWDGKPELVVALGSVWVGPNGYRYVPYLDDRYSERRLYLRDWDGDWRALGRFLAVRKVPSAP